MQAKWPTPLRAVAIVVRHGLGSDKLSQFVALLRKVVGERVRILCTQPVPGASVFDEAPNALHDQGVDLVITVGGDGTLLRAAWLFQSPSASSPPPIIWPLFAGRLGFLTACPLDDVDEPMIRAHLCPDASFNVALRSRLHVRIEPSAVKDRRAVDSCGEPYVADACDFYVLNEVGTGGLDSFG